MPVSASPIAADDDRGLLGAHRGVGLGVIGKRPVAVAERHRPHHRRRRAVRVATARDETTPWSLATNSSLASRGSFSTTENSEQVVIREHQRRQLIGERDEAGRLRRAVRDHRCRQRDADRSVRAQQRDRIGRHRLAAPPEPSPASARRPSADRRRDRAGHASRAVRGSTSISTSIGLSIALMSSGCRQNREWPDWRSRDIASSALRRVELARLQPRNPDGHHEIGLEGIDRRAQRLQHVGLDHRGRAKQARSHARQQFAFGQPVLHQAGVNVDRPRQGDAVDRQFLIMDAIGSQPGEQNSDQRDETNNETQPNHSLTR